MLLYQLASAHQLTKRNARSTLIIIIIINSNNTATTCSTNGSLHFFVEVDRRAICWSRKSTEHPQKSASIPIGKLMKCRLFSELHKSPGLSLHQLNSIRACCTFCNCRGKWAALERSSSNAECNDICPPALGPRLKNSLRHIVCDRKALVLLLTETFLE